MYLYRCNSIRTTLVNAVRHKSIMADIGLYGLAVMGQNFALNMASKGFSVRIVPPMAWCQAVVLDIMIPLRMPCLLLLMCSIWHARFLFATGHIQRLMQL